MNRNSRTEKVALSMNNTFLPRVEKQKVLDKFIGLLTADMFGTKKQSAMLTQTNPIKKTYTSVRPIQFTQLNKKAIKRPYSLNFSVSGQDQIWFNYYKFKDLQNNFKWGDQNNVRISDDKVQANSDYFKPNETQHVTNEFKKPTVALKPINQNFKQI